MCMNFKLFACRRWKKQPQLISCLEARHAPYSPHGDFFISSGLHLCLATLLGMAYGGCGAEVDKMTLSG